MPEPERTITLIYDGECPFCRRTAELFELRAKGYDVTMKNARDHLELATRLKAEGFDLNQGMVLERGEHRYFGSDAATELFRCLGETQRGWRYVSAVFFNSTLRRPAYFVLKSMRDFSLLILRKKPIRTQT